MSVLSIFFAWEFKTTFVGVEVSMPLVTAAAAAAAAAELLKTKLSMVDMKPLEELIGSSITEYPPVGADVGQTEVGQRSVIADPPIGFPDSDDTNWWSSGGGGSSEEVDAIFLSDPFVELGKDKFV